MGARNDAASVLPRVFPVTQKTFFSNESALFSTARPWCSHFGVLLGGPAAAGGCGTHHPESESGDHHGCLLSAGWFWNCALRGQAGGGGAGEVPPVGSGR